MVENIVIITETGGYRNPKINHDSDGTDTELFAYHYSISNNQASETWKYTILFMTVQLTMKQLLLKILFRLQI
jgi:hypothetical protein